MAVSDATLQGRLASANSIIQKQKQEIDRITGETDRDIGRQKQELERLFEENRRLSWNNDRLWEQNQSLRQFVSDLQNRFNWIGFHLQQNPYPPVVPVAQQPAPAHNTFSLQQNQYPPVMPVARQPGPALNTFHGFLAPQVAHPGVTAGQLIPQQQLAPPPKGEGQQGSKPSRGAPKGTKRPAAALGGVQGAMGPPATMPTDNKRARTSSRQPQAPAKTGPLAGVQPLTASPTAANTSTLPSTSTTVSPAKPAPQLPSTSDSAPQSTPTAPEIDLELFVGRLSPVALLNADGPPECLHAALSDATKKWELSQPLAKKTDWLAEVRKEDKSDTGRCKMRPLAG